MNIILAGFAVYAVTFIITDSYIMRHIREMFRACMEGTGMVRRTLDGEVIFDDPSEAEVPYTGYDMISCRMCVGFWVAMALCLWQMSFWDTLAAYGVSYFLSTQERP